MSSFTPSPKKGGTTNHGGVAFGSWLCKNTLSQGPEWDEVLMRTGLSGFDYARIAAISGCMPIMFITLVRL